MGELTLEFEGKKKTVQGESVEELGKRVEEFAKENGLRRFIVKNEKGDKVSPKEIQGTQKVRLLRTEVAG